MKPNIFAPEAGITAIRESAPMFLEEYGIDTRQLLDDRIGYGMFAQVFQLTDGRVLKLTTDRDDAEAAEVVRRDGPMPGLAMVYDVRRIAVPVCESLFDPQHGGEWTRRESPLFAVIVEMVLPLTRATNEDAERARDAFLRLVDQYPDFDHVDAGDVAAEERLTPHQEKYYEDVARGWRWLSNRGFEVRDLRRPNFGVATGDRMVLFDFGFQSASPEAPDVAIPVASNPEKLSRVQAVFDEEMADLREQFPDAPRVELRHDERAGGDDGSGAGRQFAYCKDGHPISIAFAAKAEGLPEAQLRGLVRHELGHALDYAYGADLEDMLDVDLPSGGERRADVIAEAVWGDPIEYDDRDIQCVGCEGVSPRPSHLRSNAPRKRWNES